MPSDVPKVVRMSIFVSGRAAWISAVAVAPSFFGIMRSMMTMSGLSFNVFFTASSPSSASPTISKPSCVPRREASPILTIAWSSAMSILVLTFMAFSFSLKG